MYRIKASHLKIVKETIRVNNIDKDQQRQFDSLFRALKYSIAMGNCQKFKETHNGILELMPDLDIDQYYIEQDNLQKKYGKGWAIITGGSSGIGKQFCLQLAKQGFNICIISKNEQNIQKTIDEIKNYINDRLRKNKNKTKKFGVISLSCAAGEYTIPYISVYSASKQFLDVFTRSLNIETNKNIDILSVKPLKVQTSLFKNIQINKDDQYENIMEGEKPELLVKSALNQLGNICKSKGTFKQQLQNIILKIMNKQFLWQTFKNQFDSQYSQYLSIETKDNNIQEG